jgi:hypothetical protein
MKSTHFSLLTSSIDCAGGQKNSKNYSSANSMGQSLSIGRSQSIKYDLCTGFQYVSRQEILVSVEDNTDLTAIRYHLSQNFPNPFNPETSFEFSLTQTNLTTFSIFNVLGQEIVTLVNEVKNPGTYKITWNGLDENGEKVDTGVYFYKIESGDFMDIRKMILIK